MATSSLADFDLQHYLIPNESPKAFSHEPSARSLSNSRGAVTVGAGVKGIGISIVTVWPPRSAAVSQLRSGCQFSPHPFETHQQLVLRQFESTGELGGDKFPITIRRPVATELKPSPIGAGGLKYCGINSRNTYRLDYNRCVGCCAAGWKSQVWRSVYNRK